MCNNDSNFSRHVLKVIRNLGLFLILSIRLKSFEPLVGQSPEKNDLSKKLQGLSPEKP